MNTQEEIRIRAPFRILGGLICLGLVAAFILDPVDATRFMAGNAFSLVSLLVVFPLFVYCSLFGKMPNVITRHVSEEIYRDLANVDTLFTEFNAKSIAATLVFLAMVFFFYYLRTG